MREILLAGFLLAACGGPHGTDPARAGAALTICGSDTMVVLVQRWAEAFMRDHREVVLQVSGGGSGAGLAALRHGTADLATASRRMAPEERRAIEAARRARVNEHPVAIDAVAIYVHPRNPLRAIALDELASIYRGHTRTWEGLAGWRAPIVVYGRESSSGTYSFFKEHVLAGADFASEMQSLPGTAAVVHAVSRDPNAIGYGGLSFSAGARALPVRVGEETIEASPANAASSRYPLSRLLYVYTVGDESASLQAWLDFVVGEHGRDIATHAGFSPLAEAR